VAFVAGCRQLLFVGGRCFCLVEVLTRELSSLLLLAWSSSSLSSALLSLLSLLPLLSASGALFGLLHHLGAMLARQRVRIQRKTTVTTMMMVMMMMMMMQEQRRQCPARCRRPPGRRRQSRLRWAGAARLEMNSCVSGIDRSNWARLTLSMMNSSTSTGLKKRWW
jgi:hypothetical protein